MIFRFYATSTKPAILEAGCRLLIDYHMAYYYSPRGKLIRFKTRLESRAENLARELSALGLKIIKKYDYD